MMQTRRFLGVGAAAATMIGLLLPMGAAVAATPCTFNDNATTQTHGLTGDCDLTATLAVEDGWSIDGNGHTITVDGTGFTGPIIQSASGTGGGAPASMNVKHLTIQAVGFGAATGPHVGILFDGAKGTVSDVRILGVSPGTGGNDGYGVEADNSVGAVFAGTDQVKVDNGTTISGYQRAGVYAHGSLKVTVLRATIGNADPVSGQDVYGVLATDGAHGSVKESQISLTDTEPATASSFSAGVQLDGTRRVEVRRNVFTGTAADFGISVQNPTQSARTTAIVDCNLFRRNDSSATDNYGVAVGLWNDGPKTNVQLTNATFEGNWNSDSGTITGTTVTAGPANVHDGHCPPPAPTHVVAGGGDRRTKVTWRPTAAPVYAPLTGYRVSAKAAGHPAIAKTVGPSATSAKLTGLNNSRTYVVTVKAQSNGGQAGASAGLSPTKTTLTAVPGTIHKGGKSTLQGTVTSRDPKVHLSKRTVEIWAKPKGGHWSKIGTVRTRGGGHFSRTVKPVKTTSYKAVYGGHPGLASSHTAKVVVKG